MLEIGVSVLRTKIKIPQNQRFHGIFDGRSDWIRTSGHLNPIQVLYQTEPHPDVANPYTYHKIHKWILLIVPGLLLIPKKCASLALFGSPAQSQIPPLIRFRASAKVSSAAGLLLIPKKACVFGSPVDRFLRQF